eukprot:6924061-Karenia_brevis.AAC.1
MMLQNLLMPRNRQGLLEGLAEYLWKAFWKDPTKAWGIRNAFLEGLLKGLRKAFSKSCGRPSEDLV